MFYRRARCRGGTYFFTVNLADRSSGLLVGHINPLRDAMRRVKQRHPFRIDAMVVLPDHLHAIWTLPAGDADFSTRWALIKAGFSRQLPPSESRRPSRSHKQERGIWQRRFWEHLIKDEEDFRHHVDYIHFNPVKHGHARRPVDWAFSSIHRFIETGRLPRDWGAEPGEEAGSFGERR